MLSSPRKKFLAKREIKKRRKGMAIKKEREIKLALKTLSMMKKNSSHAPSIFMQGKVEKKV